MSRATILALVLSLSSTALIGCVQEDDAPAESGTETGFYRPSDNNGTSPNNGANPNNGVPSNNGTPTNNGATNNGTPTNNGASNNGTPDMGEPDMGAPDMAEPDMGLPQRALIPPPNTRGIQWVRNNEMFINGLVVSMGAPGATVVNRYYDDFGANAIHLWSTGLGPELNAWLSVPRADHRWLAWTSNSGKSHTNQLLAGGMPANPPGRIGYQVGDEPRNFSQYQEMVVGVKALRQHDPSALVFLNMSASASDLDQMMQAQCADPDFDVISHDIYTLRQSQYEWLAYFRDWGLQCDKPYWRYLVSYDEADQADFPSDNDMRWHAMTGVVYGYTGHSWFLYNINNGDSLLASLFDTTGSWATPPNARHAAAANVNVELGHLGKSLTQLTSTDVRYNASYAFLQPTGTQPWSQGAGSDPYITGVGQTGMVTQESLMGFFRDDWGDTYVALMNPNHDGGTYQVKGGSDATITLTLNLNQAPPNVSRTHVTALDNFTGQLIQLPLVQEGGAHKLAVTLEAGELVLFKYDTGYPFVGQ